jgi:outer membrane lipoprotein SlyB
LQASRADGYGDFAGESDVAGVDTNKTGGDAVTADAGLPGGVAGKFPGDFIHEEVPQLASVETDAGSV